MDKSLCIFGDSITWGATDAESGGWADMLKRQYQETDEGIRTYNLGIPGDTTDGVLRRLVIEAEARKGDIAILAIGINDSQLIDEGSVERISANDFRNNISDLIDEALTLNMQIGFLGLTQVNEAKTRPIPWNTEKQYTNERIELFDGIIKDVCELRDVPYLPLMEVLGPEDLPDGLHPSAEGHRKLFSAILPFLETRFGL